MNVISFFCHDIVFFFNFTWISKKKKWNHIGLAFKLIRMLNFNIITLFLFQQQRFCVEGQVSLLTKSSSILFIDARKYIYVYICLILGLDTKMPKISDPVNKFNCVMSVEHVNFIRDHYPAALVHMGARGWLSQLSFISKYSSSVIWLYVPMYCSLPCWAWYFY